MTPNFLTDRGSKGRDPVIEGLTSDPPTHLGWRWTFHKRAVPPANPLWFLKTLETGAESAQPCLGQQGWVLCWEDGPCPNISLQKQKVHPLEGASPEISYPLPAGAHTCGTITSGRWAWGEEVSMFPSSTGQKGKIKVLPSLMPRNKLKERAHASESPELIIQRPFFSSQLQRTIC